MTTDYSAIVFILGSVVLTLFALFLIIFLVVQKRRQYRFLLEKQRLQHQYQSQLLQSRIEVQEQALKDISEEIHDNVGQVLSLTKLHLYKIARSNSDEAVLKDARTSSELLTKAITDLRSISHTANGRMVLNTGLEESIKKELGYVFSAKNINCNFNIQGTPYQLGSDRELLIFRILQETVANAIKHGNADKLDILLSYQPQTFSMEIGDNGSGFDTTSKSNGLGLTNMNLRAELLKGNLSLESEKGKGTNIKLEIPVAHDKRPTHKTGNS